MTHLSEILADSPGAYWPCDDGTGAPADASGNGQNLTLDRGVNTYLSDSLFGTVVDATVGDWTTAFGAPQSAYSLEAWVYLNGTPTDEDCPVADWGGTTANGVMLIFASNANPAAYHAASALTAPSTVSTGTWHQIAVTWDGSTRKLYVDGAQVATEARAGAPGTSNGAGSASRVNNYGAYNATRRLNGRLAHIAWFSSALSAARVLAHYNQANSSPSSSSLLDHTLPRGVLRGVVT